jgi:hypothetical protein
LLYCPIALCSLLYSLAGTAEEKSGKKPGKNIAKKKEPTASRSVTRDDGRLSLS